MKRKIAIAIQPRFTKEILKGYKRFEYRRFIPNCEISTIFIYETAPTSKIVAEVEVLEVLRFPTEELWNRTKEYSGIEKQFYDEYFKGKEIANAYKLGKIKVYDNPKDLDEFGIKMIQSFAYIK